MLVVYHERMVKTMSTLHANKQFSMFCPGRPQPYFCALFPPPQAFDYHTHMDFYEFALIVNGCCRNTYRGKETMLHIGDVLYVRPGEAHSLEATKPDSMHYVFLFQQDWLEQKLKDHPHFLDFIQKTPLTARTLSQQQSNYIGYLGSSIAGRILPEDSDEIVDGLISALLLACYRDISPQTNSGVARYVNHLIYLMDVYQLLDVDISEIYRFFPISQTTLINHFKRTTGYTPVEYRQKKRLEYAAHLLTLENYPVSAVVAQVGITCQSYFSVLFKKEYGMTPKQYQIAHRRK